VTYNLSKPNHKGQRSIRLDSIEFIDRIATLIPIPHRHRRHYFGTFAPNSPLRKQVVANAGRNPENFIPPPLKIQSDKVYKVSLEWAFAHLPNLRGQSPDMLYMKAIVIRRMKKSLVDRPHEWD